MDRVIGKQECRIGAPWQSAHSCVGLCTQPAAQVLPGRRLDPLPPLLPRSVLLVHSRPLSAHWGILNTPGVLRTVIKVRPILCFRGSTVEQEDILRAVLPTILSRKEWGGGPIWNISDAGGS